MNFFEFIYYFLIYGAILTYIAWGIIIGIESILALNGSKFAIKWIKSRHKAKNFEYMLIIFLPIIFLCYILLEIIPFLLKIENRVIRFDLTKIYNNIYINPINP